MNFSSYKVGPKSTPKLIKIILTSSAIINILIAIIPQKYPAFLLGLSLEGMKTGFFWQVLTNLLIIENPSVTFGFILHLLFNLSIIWVLGSSIIELKGIKHFIYIVSIASVFSSFLALGLMFIFSPSYIFLGGSILIYSMATAWLILHGDAKIVLFSSLPFKGTWLILGLMAINLFSLLSKGAYICFFVYIFSSVVSYFLSLLLWKVHSPFKCLKKMELSIIHFAHKTSGKTMHKMFKGSKIYDFKTGEPIVDDDEFMNAMLTRISLYGEEVITKGERKRMDKISKKKRKNPK